MGRRFGDKNASTKRAETAARVRLHRERKREKAEQEAEALEQQEKFFRELRAEGLLFFGETAPTVNCINISEEIEMARVWSRLLNVPDIEPGQNKRGWILSVLKAWCDAGCPLLHLESQTLSQRRAETPDIEEYQFPDGSEENYEYEPIPGETNA